MKRPLRVALMGAKGQATGGVASSVSSLFRVLSEVENVKVLHLSWKEVWRLPAWRPDVIHCNASKPGKRLLGAAFSRLLGAKAVATIHGDRFDHDMLVNRLFCRLLNGAILLNHRIHQDFAGRYGGLSISLQTPIFSESRKEPLPDLEPDIETSLRGLAGRRIALAYASGRAFQAGQETYGFSFLGDLLPELERLGFAVVFLDVKGEHSDADLNPHGASNYVHLKRPTSFRSMCHRADMYLRPTSTDGSSVAVLEALEEGLPVLASDAVDRPYGVRTYRFGSRESFLEALQDVAQDRKRPDRAVVGLTSAGDYLAFIKALSAR